MPLICTLPNTEIEGGFNHTGVYKHPERGFREVYIVRTETEYEERNA